MRYASTYLRGHPRLLRIQSLTLVLILSVCVMVSANHLLLFLLSWAATNLCLCALLYDPRWEAARASLRLAAGAFIAGFISLSIAFGILAYVHNTWLIQELLALHPFAPIPALFLIIAALAQCSAWPFHRWLISCLNIPTPVSALMHAGVVNGGGFLVARFAPLFAESGLLPLLFTLGFTSALLGTLWKLLQPNVKNMLACSTVGQMGFMLAQCGLGLFSAAIAHLCWHGVSKAYLFLSSGNAAFDRAKRSTSSPSLPQFIVSIVSGLLGSYVFCWICGKNWFSLNSTLVLQGLAFVVCAQSAISLLQQNSGTPRWIIPIASAIVGLLYGGSVELIERPLLELGLEQVQPLHFMHVLALIALIICWLAQVFEERWRKHPLFDRLYVSALNASQPHPHTLTTVRQPYFNNGEFHAGC